MSNIKYTSGPWHVDGEEPGFTVNRLLVKSDTNHQPDICVLNFHADPVECRANAELIAEAPRMFCFLEALCKEKALPCCKITRFCKKCFVFNNL